jgi:ribonuclease BN (tRNA processing enzyme)
VLGSCGAWPEAGRACSGFLLEHDGFRIVLDLGFGTLPRLLAHCPGGAVDAVVITHEHSDHCVDLNGLFRVRYVDADRSARIPLFSTPGVVQRVDQLEPGGDLAKVFELRDLTGRSEIGPFVLDAIRLPHHVPNMGVRLATPNLVVAYTGDTGPDPALVELGRDADLFVAEATHQGEPATDRPRNLSTAREAGRWAELAGAKRLMLTHFWPGSDRSQAVAEAAEKFSGEVVAADEGLLIDLA